MSSPLSPEVLEAVRLTLPPWIPWVSLGFQLSFFLLPWLLISAVVAWGRRRRMRDTGPDTPRMERSKIAFAVRNDFRLLLVMPLYLWFYKYLFSNPVTRIPIYVSTAVCFVFATLVTVHAWARTEQALVGPSFSRLGALRQGLVFLVFFPSYLLSPLLALGGWILYGNKGPWVFSLMVVAAITAGYLVERFGLGPRLVLATGLADLAPESLQKNAAQGASLWNASPPTVLQFRSPYARIYTHWFHPVVVISDSFLTELSESQKIALLGRAAADVAEPTNPVSGHWRVAGVCQGFWSFALMLLMFSRMIDDLHHLQNSDAVLSPIYLVVGWLTLLSLLLVWFGSRVRRRTRALDKAAGISAGTTALEALDVAGRINLTLFLFKPNLWFCKEDAYHRRFAFDASTLSLQPLRPVNTPTSSGNFVWPLLSFLPLFALVAPDVVLKRMGDEKTENYLRVAFSLNQGSFDVNLVRLGDVWEAKGKTREAAVLYRACASPFSLGNQCRRKLIGSLSRQGRCDEARRAYTDWNAPEEKNETPSDRFRNSAKLFPGCEPVKPKP